MPGGSLIIRPVYYILRASVAVANGLRHGPTAREFGERIGVSERHMLAVGRGARAVRPKTARKIMRGLNMRWTRTNVWKTFRICVPQTGKEGKSENPLLDKRGGVFGRTRGTR